MNVIHSDLIQILSYIKTKNSGSPIKITIDVNENNMNFEFFNINDEKCIVTIYRATADNQSSFFTTVTKTERLNEQN